ACRSSASASDSSAESASVSGDASSRARSTQAATHSSQMDAWSPAMRSPSSRGSLPQKEQVRPSSAASSAAIFSNRAIAGVYGELQPEAALRRDLLPLDDPDVRFGP